MSTLTAESGHLSLLSRMNPRLVTIAAVFAVLIGYPTYSLVRHGMSGGIEHHGDREDVDLKKLGHFTFNDMTDTESKIPPEDRALDGKKVALEGFVFNPTGASSDKLYRFEFVYNIQKCCYGGPPLVQERVFGTLDRTANVSADLGQEVRCIGVLHVKPQRDPKTNKCDSIYTMDVQQIEPL